MKISLKNVSAFEFLFITKSASEVNFTKFFAFFPFLNVCREISQRRKQSFLSF